ncbi:MAG TPA: hypothetical protein VIY48_15995 [Candidatus Paceibacterota bacterium]
MFVDKVTSAQVTISHGTSAYTANDVIGGLLTFSLTSPSGCGILNGLKITDEDNEGAALDIYIFNDVPTTIADDAAGALAIGDLDKLVCKVEVAAADYEAVNSLKFAIKDEASEGLNRACALDAKGNLYAYVICTGTPTYASGKALKMTLYFLTS